MPTTTHGEPDHYAFADEFGDSNLNIENGGSTYFIIVAALVAPADLDGARQRAEEIRSRRFQKGEMKSSSIAGNDERRARVLAEMLSIPFRFRAVVIDKREIDRESGLIYKQPFFKFLNGVLYQSLYRAFPRLCLIADQHGGTDFMTGFERYVRQTHQPDLFTRADFRFGESRSEPLIQLADVIAGSLARYYEPSVASDRAPEFVELLRQKSLGIETWPPLWFGSTDEPVATTSHDAAIKRYCVNQVAIFVDKHRDARGEHVEHQLAVAKYLLFHHRFVSEAAYVSADALLEMLASQRLPLSAHLLRTKVIAKLRDAGVIVGSSPRGYKIPSTHADLNDFVARADGVIGPMLHRLQLARTAILTSTSREIDIVASPGLEYLRKLLDEIPARRAEQTTEVEVENGSERR